MDDYWVVCKMSSVAIQTFAMAIQINKQIALYSLYKPISYILNMKYKVLFNETHSIYLILNSTDIFNTC